MKFTGKRILITGGARGIGSVMAKSFAKNGAEVIINYRASEEKAQSLCNEVVSNGGKAIAIQADVSNGREVRMMAKAIEENHGPIDILINNAGWAKPQALADIDTDNLNKQLMTNIASVINCTQAFSPLLKEGGRIVNITSLAAKGSALFPVYSATKAAVNALTKSFAQELGPRKITVNAVAPSAVESDLYYEVGLDAHKEQALQATPLQFLGDATDVAQAVTFFASEQARWITGEILQVSGGRAM